MQTRSHWLIDCPQRTALDTALRYFREAPPKHTAGEEVTLFPRLRSLDRPEVKARLAQAWLTSASLPSAVAARFSLLVTGLADLYRDHIGVEEHEVFPVAVAMLGQPQREEVGGGMAARGGLRQKE